MSLSRKIIYAILLLIALLLIGAVIAYKFIDDQTIEAQALTAIQEGLQRKVVIDGEFKLSRSLQPTLKTTTIRIASADWDPQPYMLEAARFEIGINLLDLLRGVVTIKNVVFDDATINIVRNREGQSNLDFGTDKETTAKQNTLSFLDIADIEINKLTINYADQQAEQTFVYVVDKLSLQPKNKHVIQINAVSRFNDQPIELASSMCRIRQLLRANDCKIVAQINVDPLETRIEGKLNIGGKGHENRLQVRTRGGDISEMPLLNEVTLPITQSIQLQFQLLGPINSLHLQELDGEIELVDSRLKLSGDIVSVNQLRGTNLQLAASGTKPEWIDLYQNYFSGKLIDRFSVQAKLNDEADTWNIADIDANFEIGQSELNAQGKVNLANGIPNVQLNLQGEGADPAWLNNLQEFIAADQIDKFSIQANLLNPENVWTLDNIEASINTANNTLSAQGNILFSTEHGPEVTLNVDALGDDLQNFSSTLKQPLPSSEQFSINTGLTYKGTLLTLDPLSIEIDDTKLGGNSIIEFSSPPNIRAQLKADSLNAAHIASLLPAEQTSDTKQDQAKTLFSDQTIDLDWLNTANTDISLSVNELVYKQATLTDIQTDISAKNNQALVELNSLRYKDASLQTSAAIDANINQYTYNLYTEAFDLGGLLNELDLSSTLQGKIDAAVNLASNGTSSKQLADNASGKITAVMTEGSLKDAPIDLLASNLLVELMPGRPDREKTKIECMFVQLSGNEGIFKSDAAMLNTENIVMTVDGMVDLTQETLNFALIPKPKDIELFTLDANIRVKGDITDPSFSLDKGSLFKKLLKSAASIALGPAVLAVPFASMGADKQAKCFDEVASTTTKAVEAQQEAERKAKEEAERKLEEESSDAAAQGTDDIKKPIVEALNWEE